MLPVFRPKTSVLYLILIPTRPCKAHCHEQKALPFHIQDLPHSGLHFLTTFRTPLKCHQRECSTLITKLKAASSSSVTLFIYPTFFLSIYHPPDLYISVDCFLFLFQNISTIKKRVISIFFIALSPMPDKALIKY